MRLQQAANKFGVSKSQAERIRNAKMWRPPRVLHLLTWPSTDLRSTAFHTDTYNVLPVLSAVIVIIKFHVLWFILSAYVSFQLSYRSDSLTYMWNPWKQPTYPKFTVSLHVTYNASCKTTSASGPVSEDSSSLQCPLLDHFLYVFCATLKTSFSHT